jgi:hypothetical protein
MIDRLLKIIYMETKKTKIEKKMGLEKRSCERYDLQLPVNIKWKNFSGKIIEDSTTCKNISSGGTYIILSNLIEKGSEIDLWFDLPIAVEEVKKSRVFARGKVVRNIKEHKTAFGHGIMFMGYKFLRLEQ